MKYNDEILNKIAESYSKKIDENTNLDNVILGYLEMMKNGSKIHIKPENRGKFNATKKKTGKTSHCLPTVFKKAGDHRSPLLRCVLRFACIVCCVAVYNCIQSVQCFFQLIYIISIRCPIAVFQ